MDKLWAPWRVGYITQIGKTRKCVFCKILREKKDRKNFIFMRTRYSFAVLNIYPYNNGHALILPYRHVNDLSKLGKEETIDLIELLGSVQQRLGKAIKPGGFNIGLNIGRVAGAGFPGHVHIHIVPRWKGDVNFMPILTGTKVISQSLNALYQKLTKGKS
ncbi:MAG: HIT family hydrolase [Omnitrophica WOR_2 bacterium GWA2_47_8]|nr:MAG: HIT family hydrolase [Omnitrophica WOR_2 bacterium GWA2_47_8]